MCPHPPQDVAALLLQHSADVDWANSKSNTPLSVATAEGHAAVVNMLVDGGADLNKPNAKGNIENEPTHFLSI